MLRELSWPQFLEWQEYFALEPQGELRDDWRAAQICSAVLNAAAIQMRSPTRFRVKDLLLEFTDEPVIVEEPEPDWKRLKFIGQMCAALANADEERKQKRKR